MRNGHKESAGHDRLIKGSENAWCFDGGWSHVENLSHEGVYIAQDCRKSAVKVKDKFLKGAAFAADL